MPASIQTSILLSYDIPAVAGVPETYVCPRGGNVIDAWILSVTGSVDTGVTLRNITKDANLVVVVISPEAPSEIFRASNIPSEVGAAVAWDKGDVIEIALDEGAATGVLHVLFQATPAQAMSTPAA